MTTENHIAYRPPFLIPSFFLVIQQQESEKCLTFDAVHVVQRLGC